MMTIDGLTLRAYLRAAGKTQQELADDLGCSLRSVQGWAAGGVPPRRSEAVLEALGLDPADVVPANSDGPDEAVRGLVDEHGAAAVVASVARVMATKDGDR